jgi:predicted nucleotidyltransferase
VAGDRRAGGGEDEEGGGEAMTRETFRMPTQAEIVQVLRKHPLVRLREKVVRAFLVGSFSRGQQNEMSDVDILLEVEPHPGYTAHQLEEHYRRALMQYFVTHNIRERRDSVHPQWCGRRVDLYFTYDAEPERRTKILLVKRSRT